MSDKKEDDDDPSLRVSAKAAMAIIISVFGVGGANLWTGTSGVDEIKTRVKSLQSELRQFSPMTAMKIEAIMQEMETRQLIYLAQEATVREQRRTMESHLRTIEELLREGAISDERIHRAIEDIIKLQHEMLRNQDRYFVPDHSEAKP
jgi:multidrug resistance efflux pump